MPINSISDYNIALYGPDGNKISNNININPATTDLKPFTLSADVITSGYLWNPFTQGNPFTQEHPVIQDVDVIEKKGNPISVVVYFNDGTKQKATCQKGDVFDLETGIALCLLKWFYAKADDGSDGTRNANNAIRKGLKVRKKHLAEIEEAEKKAEKIKQDNIRYQERKYKKAMKKREARINEMAEAFRRAMVDN